MSSNSISSFFPTFSSSSSAYSANSSNSNSSGGRVPFYLREARYRQATMSSEQESTLSSKKNQPLMPVSFYNAKNSVESVNSPLATRATTRKNANSDVKSTAQKSPMIATPGRESPMIATSGRESQMIATPWRESQMIATLGRESPTIVTLRRESPIMISSALKQDLAATNNYQLFPADPAIQSTWLSNYCVGDARFRQHFDLRSSHCNTNATPTLDNVATTSTTESKTTEGRTKKTTTTTTTTTTTAKADYNGNKSPVGAEKQCDAVRVAFQPNPPAKMFNDSGVKTWECGGGFRVNVATAHTQGYRAEMEDVFIEYKNVADDILGTIYVFGVCDGHGGGAIAEWLRANLGVSLVSSLRRGESLESAFLDAEALMESQLGAAVVANTGATACVAIVLPKHNIYYVANAGDSRAVLVDLHNPVTGSRRITTDHKPNDAVEHNRIRQSGGSVMTMFGVSRINGQLSVSRGFGDAALKPYGFTVRPDVFGPFVLQERFPIVLACDGLYDVVSDVGVAATAAHYLLGCASPVTLERSVMAQRAAEQLRNVAFASDSRDNISVMLIDAWKQ